jgi:hypothetical protein
MPHYKQREYIKFEEHKSNPFTIPLKARTALRLERTRRGTPATASTTGTDGDTAAPTAPTVACGAHRSCSQESGVTTTERDSEVMGGKELHDRMVNRKREKKNRSAAISTLIRDPEGNRTAMRSVRTPSSVSSATTATRPHGDTRGTCGAASR